MVFVNKVTSFTAALTVTPDAPGGRSGMGLSGTSLFASSTGSLALSSVSTFAEDAN